MSDSKYLSNEKQSILYNVLTKHKLLSRGTIGTWKTKPVDIELQPGAKPYYSKPYPLPWANEAIFCKGTEQLFQLGVLKQVNLLEWGVPTFIQPKKNGTLGFLSDFRKLNERTRRKPLPIPKIQDMLLILEGFTYASSLDSYRIVTRSQISLY